MKRFGKLIAILLALTLLFSLAACSGSSSSAAGGSITGKWTCSFDTFKLVDFAWNSTTHSSDEQRIYDLCEIMCKNVSISMVLTLNEDNTCSIAMDEASMRTAVDGMIKNTHNNIMECMSIITGLSQSELRAQMAEKGMTEADLQAALDQQFDASAMLEGMTMEEQTGTYTYENGKLVITDKSGTRETWTVSLNGNTLKVTDIDSASADSTGAMMKEMLLPMVFKK